MAAFDPASVLPDDLLARLRARAAAHDRANTFPEDDLAELSASGYLAILAPVELGGAGLGLAEASVPAAAAPLATAAPATALAINMHLVWTGVAKVLADRGIDSLRFVHEGAVAGEVFAFGISGGRQRPGPVRQRHPGASRPEDGSLRGSPAPKIFTSLAPGVDPARPARPGHHQPGRPEAGLRVRARAPRHVINPGRLGHSSACGAPSRAPPNCTAAKAPDRPAVGPPGRSRARTPTRSCSASSVSSKLLLASVYTGIARQRALERGRRSHGRSGASPEEDRQGLQPGPRHPLADRRDGAGLRRPSPAAGRAVSRRRPRSPTTARAGSRCWPGVKHRAVTTAKAVVDDALLASGGSAYFASSELSRLYRDVIAGMFHPSDPESAHATVASAWLGPLEP